MARRWHKGCFHAWICTCHTQSCHSPSPLMATRNLESPEKHTLVKGARALADVMVRTLRGTGGQGGRGGGVYMRNLIRWNTSTHRGTKRANRCSFLDVSHIPVCVQSMQRKCAYLGEAGEVEDGELRGGPIPRRPTLRDRHHLQHTMLSDIEIRQGKRVGQIHAAGS